MSKALDKRSAISGVTEPLSLIIFERIFLETPRVAAISFILIKELKAKGAKMIRQGGNHEFWESVQGYRFPVPRHNEINEMLAREILKQVDK